MARIHLTYDHISVSNRNFSDIKNERNKIYATVVLLRHNPTARTLTAIFNAIQTSLYQF